MAKSTAVPCPCGSRRILKACCLPLIEGAPAPTAEALMRSRYTAYALRDPIYIRATWHPSTRPADIALSDTQRWTGLEIRATAAGGPADDAGDVEFVAHFRERGRPGALHERSRFVREADRWFYVDGDLLPAP